MEADFVTRADQLDEGGTPLRRFTGRFIGSDDSSMRIFPKQVEGRQSLVVDLNFVDLDPASVESTVPWNYPVAQISLNYRATRSGKPSARGSWGLLVKSAAELGFPDLQDLVGQVVTMECEPDHEFGENRETGEKIVGAVWRVVEVHGGKQAEAPEQVTDDMEYLAALLHGKDVGSFAQAALQDPVGRRHQSEIFDGEIIPRLISEGKVEVDERGIHWQVGKERG